MNINSSSFSSPILDKPKACNYCKTSDTNKKLLICSSCHFTKYCNIECQKKDWPQHKTTCNHKIKKINKPSQPTDTDEPIVRYGFFDENLSEDSSHLCTKEPVQNLSDSNLPHHVKEEILIRFFGVERMSTTHK